MIDLHCHLLPGIDDGPKTMEESVNMARYAVAQGIQGCVVTPHIHPGWYDNDRTSIQKAYQSFREVLNSQRIALNVVMAAEVRVCSELPYLIKQDKIPFLGSWEEKQVLLLEFPHDHIPLGSDKLVSWLLEKNIVPLIAHPERNQAIIDQPRRILPFKEMGCLLQITASSVTGLFGSAIKECALMLLQENLVTVLASDAHNLKKRRPELLPAVDILMPLIGETNTMALVLDNPRKIISARETLDA